MLHVHLSTSVLPFLTTRCIRMFIERKRVADHCCLFQLAMKGSSYSGLLERHNIHTSNVEHIVKSLR